MKNLLVFTFCSFIFVSCREMRALSKEKTTENVYNKLYFIDENKSKVRIKANGIDHDFIFDTGAGATIFNNPKFVLNEKKIIKLKTIVGFDGKTKTTSQSYLLDSINANFYSATDKYVLIAKNENTLGCSNILYDGILGQFFEDLKKPIAINYEKGFIELLDANFDTTGYIPVDVKFNWITNMMSLKLSINGNEDYYLFDTGNKFALGVDKKLIKPIEKKIVGINMYGLGVNNMRLQKHYDMYNGEFNLGNKFSFNSSFAIDSSSDRSILSLGFIKNFNWIIDKKNKIAYCKPIYKETISASFKIPTVQQYASVQNEKIIIGYALEGLSKYTIGSEIISVDGKMVTSENVCEMIKLLNPLNNWINLNVGLK